MIVIIIYKAINKINGKIYIGQTIKSLKSRQLQHENAHKYKSFKNAVFANAIKKYGKENFEWSIIDTATTLNELNEKEEFWIKELNSLVCNRSGYNVKYGGNNHKHIERTKSLISKAQIGEKNHMFGRIGKDNPTSKKVIDVTEGVIYESASECAKSTKCTVTKICAVCRGERGSTNKRIFRYLDENNNIIEPDNAKVQFRRRIVNLTTGITYENLKEAVSANNKKSESGLSNELKNNNGICYYFNQLWCYEGIKQEVIETFKPQVKKKGHQFLSQSVKNVTTGEIFESIAAAARSVNRGKSLLSKKLKQNKCVIDNNEFIKL